jgi:hypothetical protein
MQYLLAYRSDRTLGIAFTEEWSMTLVNYLMDHGYEVKSSSEQHWNRSIDEYGNPVLRYELTDENSFFDIGT